VYNSHINKCGNQKRDAISQKVHNVLNAMNKFWKERICTKITARSTKPKKPTCQKQGHTAFANLIGKKYLTRSHTTTDDTSEI